MFAEIFVYDYDSVVRFSELLAGVLLHGPNKAECLKQVKLKLNLLPMPILEHGPSNDPKPRITPLATLKRGAKTNQGECKALKLKVDQKFENFIRNFCASESNDSLLFHIHFHCLNFFSSFLRKSQQKAQTEL
jgi:hypothetical protein